MSKTRILTKCAGLIALAALSLGGCSQTTVTSLRHFPLDDSSEVLQPALAELDRSVSSDGQGSLRFQIDTPQTIHLLEVRDLAVEDCALTYQAMLRTENLTGRVYLEMWCATDSLGEFFSRDLATPILTATDWVIESTPFFLEKGQTPRRIFLNVVCEGTGTVWVDDILLYKTTS